LLGRARELLNKVMKGSRAMAVSAIEKSYWIDINAGGALAFPKPNITAAVDQIEKSRRDLLAPLAEIVSRKVPLGSISAPIVSRLIFMYFAPEIKVRLTAACCCDSCRSSALSSSLPQFAFTSAFSPGRA
jgi:hypothetical protein